MQAVSADLRAPEPTPEDLKRISLNIEVLEEFAQNMSRNIIQSFVSQMEMEEDCMTSKCIQNQLVEEFASAVVDLRDVWRSQNVEDHQDEMDPDLQTSRETSRPPFPQSGLPIVGSIDYPDAPPTTPLLPELEKNRQSFDRKLKGGLAKVFLPSPPPTTPKFKDSDGDPNDPQVELMEHLMLSLSTDDLERDYLPVGSQRGAKMEAFAEGLSCDIIDWVLSDENEENRADDLHVLAHQLAETIITSSLDEAKTLV
ncbi:hypothetical protein JOQ06_020520 [Pogonophryne albipinna]|uniref:Uncharacterized protein n=1 Tax=Pogonophryne albipinna TaxID=1090488 RepID=A0AAD6BPF0_9TELE|nr:hypothetical protein JOQ06_020520 [Pogonophryne albipinna]